MKTSTVNNEITTTVIKEYVDRARSITDWEPEGDDNNYTTLQKAVMAAIGLQSVRRLWNEPARTYAVVNISEYVIALYGSLIDPDKMISLYNVIADRADLAVQMKKENLPYPQTKDVYRYMEVIGESDKLR